MEITFSQNYLNWVFFKIDIGYVSDTKTFCCFRCFYKDNFKGNYHLEPLQLYIINEKSRKLKTGEPCNLGAKFLFESSQLNQGFTCLFVYLSFSFDSLW